MKKQVTLILLTVALALLAVGKLTAMDEPFDIHAANKTIYDCVMRNKAEYPHLSSEKIQQMCGVTFGGPSRDLLIERCMADGSTWSECNNRLESFPQEVL